MGRLIDLHGQTFADWTVIRKEASTYQPMWLCRCACGTERKVSGANLRSGATTGCGCTRVHFVAHGHARRNGKTRTYRTWKAMHSRCAAGHRQAKDYHDRGITVCARWSDYSAFLSDMGEAPDGMSIDRIDNDSGYWPGNCRWADSATQRRNCRRVQMIETPSGPQVLKDAVRALGVSDTAVHQERARNGGTMQEAFDRVAARRG